MPEDPATGLANMVLYLLCKWLKEPWCLSTSTPPVVIMQPLLPLTALGQVAELECKTV